MKKLVSLFLCIAFIFPQTAFSASRLDGLIGSAREYLLRTVPTPTVGSVGGEWTVMGLSRGGELPNGYAESYYAELEAYVKACDGVLHTKKYTEYSRVILSVTAIGKNPENVGGYNLLIPLSDFEKTTFQGVNGAIWALIALDSGNYKIPQNPNGATATREMYIEHILNSKLPDGGWSMGGTQADADLTAMALQALAKYRTDPSVSAAAEQAVETLSLLQQQNGSFSSNGVQCAESCAQVLTALSELGISYNDARFVKNGKSTVSAIEDFAVQGGGFKHTAQDAAANLMASEQCFYALVAARRFEEGKNSLYLMTDALPSAENRDVTGLPEKNADITVRDTLYPKKTFDDIKNYPDGRKIEILAEKGIINGKTENLFDPSGTMTRAEFSTIVTNALGLPLGESRIFADVLPSDWFYRYVGTAYAYGIVKGVSETEFNPNGTISRQEAAVMTARAAKLCGIDTDLGSSEIRDVLSVFPDYVAIAPWASAALAFCLSNGIISDDRDEINPSELITRGEVASMVYGTLKSAMLLRGEFD